MEKKDLICIICPVGCRLKIYTNEHNGADCKVEGATCKRGEIYGIKELTNPTRILTTTVKIKNAPLRRIPVRTDGEIPKAKIIPCMEIINEIELEAPIKAGVTIIGNILDTGVNIITSRSMKAI